MGVQGSECVIPLISFTHASFIMNEKISMINGPCT